MIHINDHCVLIVLLCISHTPLTSLIPFFNFYVDIIIIFVIDAHFIVNLLYIIIVSSICYY